jgi:hypothetical protein
MKPVRSPSRRSKEDRVATLHLKEISFFLPFGKLGDDFGGTPPQGHSIAVSGKHLSIGDREGCKKMIINTGAAHSTNAYVPATIASSRS